MALLEKGEPRIAVSGLTMTFGGFVVPRDVSFDVPAGDIFVIMGASGCGKSTLLKHMIGLVEPAAGDIRYDGMSFTHADDRERAVMSRRFGVLFQSGALWSSMTLAETVSVPLSQFTDLKPREIDELVS